jgi:hypothetical protein
MEEQNEDAKEKWVDGTSNLIDLYKDLITVKIIEHTSLGASISIFGIIFLISAIFVLLFLSFGVAWWLGESMGNLKAGFMIVAGSHTVILIVLLLTARKTIIPGVRNLIIRKIYEQD